MGDNMKAKYCAYAAIIAVSLMLIFAGMYINQGQASYVVAANSYTSRLADNHTYTTTETSPVFIKPPVGETWVIDVYNTVIPNPGGGAINVQIMYTDGVTNYIVAAAQQNSTFGVGTAISTQARMRINNTFYTRVSHTLLGGVTMSDRYYGYWGYKE